MFFVIVLLLIIIVWEREYLCIVKSFIRILFFQYRIIDYNVYNLLYNNILRIQVEGSYVYRQKQKVLYNECMICIYY